MSEVLKGFVERVWQSSDGHSSALSIAHQLSSEQKNALSEVLAEIKNRAEALSRAKLAGKGGKAGFTVAKSEEEKAASILLLLSFAIYHSDGLALLPAELRQSEIRSWSEQAGLREEIVQEAVKLGPARLNPMI